MLTRIVPASPADQDTCKGQTLNPDTLINHRFIRW